MAFEVADFHGLVELLEREPGWREELRRLLLTDELLSLPELVRELSRSHARVAKEQAKLAAAQGRTQKALTALTERVDALTVRVDALAEGLAALTARVDLLTARVDALTERVDALTERVDALTERVDALTERVDALTGQVHALTAGLAELTRAQTATEGVLARLANDVGDLKGEVLEWRYRTRPFVYFRDLVRRARTLTGDELADLLEEGERQGRLQPGEAGEVLAADAVVRGRRLSDGELVYLVAEISWGVGLSDIERAARRAELLGRAGVTTVPVAAGNWISPDALEPARAFRVWRVVDGHAVAPESP